MACVFITLDNYSISVNNIFDKVDFHNRAWKSYREIKVNSCASNACGRLITFSFAPMHEVCHLPNKSTFTTHFSRSSCRPTRPMIKNAFKQGSKPRAREGEHVLKWGNRPPAKTCNKLIRSRWSVRSSVRSSRRTSCAAAAASANEES